MARTAFDAGRCAFNILADIVASYAACRTSDSDPYFEQFAVAMAWRHKATMATLTAEERRELEAHADRLLSEIVRADGP
jgi:hypothetical protein